MPDTPRILVVDDDRTIRESLVSRLSEAGYRATPADGIATARRCLSAQSFEAVLLDVRLKDGDGLGFLEELRASRPGLPVVMATAYGDSERTIRAMKAGAFEYVTKPFDLDALFLVLARAVSTKAAARLPVDDGDSTLVGRSPAMLDVWKSIGRAAAGRAPVLITGESGVGKELVARAIHEHSPVEAGPFVAVNLAALAPTILESELFGHEKGSFTGASAQREGRFELASGGTLFLDEVGDLEVPLQTKLLRVLEDGGFERVGGTTHITSNARIIAATSRQVAPGVAGAALREDLYYRLAVIRIDVPPLRDRAQDIPLLVDAFLRRAPPPRRAVTEEALMKLARYEWPGNVRQLRHVLESARVMSIADVLDEEDILLPEVPREPREPGAASNLDLRENLERVERGLIERALRESHGNRAEAARLLGIRRALLYARMKHLKIDEA
jgi:DNA-binding NtrC family response regulator